jgi:hypothetical protein
MVVVGMVAAVGLVIALSAAIGLMVAGAPKSRTINGSSSASLTVKSLATTTAARPLPPPTVRATLLGWQLPRPIGQALVLPGPAGNLVVIGGEVASGASGNGAFLVDTSSGSLHLAADLLTGVHAAAGAALGGRDLVFGGATPTATAAVQTFPAPISSSAATKAATATSAGQLPLPRAGAGAVTVGASVYVVGGYDASAADGAVVATSNGSTFRSVATLQVPVRYAAVAAVGGEIYVFGGATRSAAASKTAPATWAPVADVQRVDPVTGQSSVIGHLPVPVQGAVAVTLDGQIYVAGGQGPSGVNGAIWGFEPSASALTLAGRLQSPVSGAGVAVVGSTAWLVGGQAAGHLVGSVQTFTVVPGTSSAAVATAASSATKGASGVGTSPEATSPATPSTAGSTPPLATG